MKYKGIAVSKGVICGKTMLYRPFTANPEERIVKETEADGEYVRYQLAKTLANRELEYLYNGLVGKDPDRAKIMQAHIDILCDIIVHDDIKGAITKNCYGADWAVFTVFNKYASMLRKHRNELLRERAADMVDVCNRLMRNLQGLPEVNLAQIDNPVVIIAEDLLPSDTASINPENVLAIVTEMGGPTSHTAIIARGLGIPALLGVKDVMDMLADDDVVIVDALNGELTVSPSLEEISDAEGRGEAYRKTVAETNKYIDKEPRLPDGRYISVKLNIADPDASGLEIAPYCDGAGLFRTEFIYMKHDIPPDEETQFRIYCKVLSHFGDKPIILRTLDIGGDKKCPSLNLPDEENPFLGKRALRFCLDRPDIFQIQLRAALRAGLHGNLWVMYPMVAGLDDLRKAKEALDNAKVSLMEEGIPFKKDIPQGIMIEIPSVAIMADQIVREVDFASIGTNDLTQYALAVDRGNENVSDYYQMYHPAVFRLIRMVVRAFKEAGKPLSVCGELGGDPFALSALIGMGIDQISMSSSSVAQAKKIILSLDSEHIAKLADTVCSLDTAENVEYCLRKELAE